MPFNARQVRHERQAILDLDEHTFAYVDTIDKWVATNPEVNTFVYDGVPSGFHAWGVNGAWNLAHHQTGLPALYINSSESRKVLAAETVAYGSFDPKRELLRISLRRPG
jgi:hypothetical protein